MDEITVAYEEEPEVSSLIVSQIGSLTVDVIRFDREGCKLSRE